MILPEELFGRQVLVPVDSHDLPPGVKLTPGINQHGQKLTCLRCHTLLNPQMAQLPNQQFYCYACLNLGRVSTLVAMASLPEPNQFVPIRQPLAWKGTLTVPQTECAAVVRRVFQNSQQHLLWAVTGAGKTEMLFPGIEAAIKSGYRVCVASPRVDVCIELYPRLTAAFPKVTSCLLHGRQSATYQYTQLVVCTTHQLLRFKAAFDVLIIDEVDAFPFAENPRLAFAVQQAKKDHGALLYLTATPSQRLLKAVQQKELSISYLPLRYHGFLLPEIQTKLMPHWYQKCQQGRVPAAFRRVLSHYQKHKQRFLLFVPQVQQLPVVLKVIQRELPAYKGASVYSADPERLEKVQKMRDDVYQYLVTTTILERGVTLPGIDVLVIGADDPVFSVAALVQIAGRAGRSADRPTGLVLLGCQTYTRTIKIAIKQIKAVNRKGKSLHAKLSALQSANPPEVNH